MVAVVTHLASTPCSSYYSGKRAIGRQTYKVNEFDTGSRTRKGYKDRISAKLIRHYETAIFLQGDRAQNVMHNDRLRQTYLQLTVF